MLRIIVEGSATPPRVLEELDFVHEISRLKEAGFVGAPQGPATVEALDADGQVCWRAYYARYRGLASLATQLSREHCL